MSDAVLVAVISAISVIAVGWMNKADTKRLGRRIGGVEQTTEAVREQVQNSHRTNFRDDHDELHKDVREGFDEVNARLDRHAKTTALVDRKVTTLTKRLDEHIDGTTE